MQLRNKLAETTISAICERFGSMNVGNWTTADFLTGVRIVIRRTPRLDDSRSDSAMRPGGSTKCMIVPENQPNICIYPPSVTHILSSYNLVSCMRMSHTLTKGDGVLTIFSFTFVWVRCDVSDPARVFTIRDFDTNNNISSNMVGRRTLSHLKLDLSVAWLCRLQ